MSQPFKDGRQLFREGDIKKYIKHYTIGGRAYPVRHYPIAIRLRDRKGRAILCSHYFLSVGTLRVLHSECVPSHSFTVVGRCNQARYKRSKRDGNLNKKPFLCFGVLWSFLGLSLVSPWSSARENLGRCKGRES